MSPTCINLMRYQAAVGEQWLTMLTALAESYAAILDPRPDLALPARRVKLPFFWWW